jgi:hypothetical protein
LQVQVAKEFHTFPDQNKIGVIAGSSAHLYDHLFSKETRPAFEKYPTTWNSDKYQKLPLTPLRTKESLQSFINTIRTSDCVIDAACFRKITKKDAIGLNRDEQFNALSEDASLKLLLQETAGVPGGILSFLSGATSPCAKLPSK